MRIAAQGDSISDSSAKLFQKCRGEGQYICDFRKGRVHAIKHIYFLESFCQSCEASASMRNSHHHEGF